MARKGLIEVPQTNIPDLEQPCPICLFNKATKIPRGLTIDTLKFAPRFMLHMDFLFFDVEIIHRFTSAFVAICSATSYPFGVTFIRQKCSPLDIIKYIVTTLRNQYKTVILIRVDEYGALTRSSESTRP